MRVLCAHHLIREGDLVPGFWIDERVVFERRSMRSQPVDDLRSHIARGPETVVSTSNEQKRSSHVLHGDERVRVGVAVDLRAIPCGEGNFSRRRAIAIDRLLNRFGYRSIGKRERCSTKGP